VKLPFGVGYLPHPHDAKFSAYNTGFVIGACKVMYKVIEISVINRIKLRLNSQTSFGRFLTKNYRYSLF
jgi:hypothetical protein